MNGPAPRLAASFSVLGAMIVIFFGTSCDLALDAGGSSSPMAASNVLAGTWTKSSSSPCDQLYPARITFREATFLARKGPGQGFIVWDAGGYQVLSRDRVMLSTASDQQIEYAFSIEGDELTVRDPDGCTFRYRRVS